MSYATFNSTLWQTIKTVVLQKPENNWLIIPATSVQLGDFGAGPYCYRQCIQFNLTATGNFCINRPFPTFAIEGGILAVRYRIGWAQSFRYLLSPDVNDTESDPEIRMLKFPEEVYTGQIIKKNCVFELWAYPGSLEVVTPEIRLPISVKTFPAVENATPTTVVPTFIDASKAFPFSPIATVIQPSDYWLDNS